jgi:hypothetical protein
MFEEILNIKSKQRNLNYKIINSIPIIRSFNTSNVVQTMGKCNSTAIIVIQWQITKTKRDITGIKITAFSIERIITQTFII